MFKPQYKTYFNSRRFDTIRSSSRRMHVLKPFKAQLSREIEKCKSSDNVQYTNKGNPKVPDRNSVVNWVVKSTEVLTKEYIIKSAQICDLVVLSRSIYSNTIVLEFNTLNIIPEKLSVHRYTSISWQILH